MTEAATIHPNKADDQLYRRIVAEGCACVDLSGHAFFPSGKRCSRVQLERAVQLGRITPQNDGLFEGFSQTYIPRPIGVRLVSKIPRRILRKNIKGWRLPDGGAYVGGGSRWGNPFTRIQKVGGGKKYTPQQAKTMFREHLAGGFLKFSVLDVRMFLRGRDLADWAPLDQPSHVDILLEVANDTDA